MFSIILPYRAGPEDCHLPECMPSQWLANLFHRKTFKTLREIIKIFGKLRQALSSTCLPQRDRGNHGTALILFHLQSNFLHLKKKSWIGLSDFIIPLQNGKF